MYPRGPRGSLVTRTPANYSANLIAKRNIVEETRLADCYNSLPFFPFLLLPTFHIISSCLLNIKKCITNDRNLCEFLCSKILVLFFFRHFRNNFFFSYFLLQYDYTKVYKKKTATTSSSTCEYRFYPISKSCQWIKRSNAFLRRDKDIYENSSDLLVSSILFPFFRDITLSLVACWNLSIIVRIERTNKSENLKLLINHEHRKYFLTVCRFLILSFFLSLWIYSISISNDSINRWPCSNDFFDIYSRFLIQRLNLSI